MKSLLLFTLIAFATLGYTQSLPIDFESEVTVDDFENFDGGTAAVIDNPYMDDNNNSSKVAQIVRDGGTIWSGSKILLSDYIDFTSLNAISMKVYTTAPIGTVVKLKLEGDATTERDVTTTVTNEWETLTWDFTGEEPLYNWLVFMFDFGNVGDGSENSTFLFDDVEGLFTGIQIDHPVTFEEPDVNYTTTDFGGNISSLVIDPDDPNNTVVQVIKTDQAATWSGTTIGTPAGFATRVPLSLTESIMTARVWSPESGTPIRLKVEDAKDPTHTCETETNTTKAGEWEVIEFDFLNQAPGTELLSIGVERDWYFNMASIFMNFGTEGETVGEMTYYFDEVRFGDQVLSTSSPIVKTIECFPNPTNDIWHLSSHEYEIEQVEIYDLQGKLMVSLSPNNNEVIIDSHNISQGSYWAMVSSNGVIQTISLMKN